MADTDQQEAAHEQLVDDFERWWNMPPPLPRARRGLCQVVFAAGYRAGERKSEAVSGLMRMAPSAPADHSAAFFEGYELGLRDGGGLL